MASHFTDDDSRRKPASKSSSPRILLQFVGLIPADDLQKMSDAIEDCERIDPEEWSDSR
jgi:hypothetical protein